ncbi:hypothetical protein JCM10450v2_007273 [Rhodotorula kratochvilovae]
MPPPPPPPPRSSAAAPPPRATTSSPSAALSASAVLPTPPLSRPGTPSSAATPRMRGTALALPALMSDLGALLSSATLLRGAQFAPEPEAEDAYAPKKPASVDPAARAAELLAGVRADKGPEQLERDDAPLLADAWVAAMDRVLERAEAEERGHKGEEGKVARAEGVERWAGEVERGLAAA